MSMHVAAGVFKQLDMTYPGHVAGVWRATILEGYCSGGILFWMAAVLGGYY